MAKRTQVIRWVMTLATVLVLALLAWQCIHIYLVGNSPSNLDAGGVHRAPVFSVKIVAAHLRPIRPLLAVYVLMTVAALIAQAMDGEVKFRISISPENRLRLMKTRVAQLPDEAKALERLIQVYGLSQEEAAASIRHSDAARGAYYKNIAGTAWGDARNYSLCIDSSIGPEQTAQAILDYLALRGQASVAKG